MIHHLIQLARPALAAGAAALALTFLVPADADAQQTRRVVITDLPMAEQTEIRSEAVRSGAEADELLEQARTADGNAEYRKAADRFERSGQLRVPGSEQGVEAFREAGRAYHSADRLKRASRAWEEAANRGLVRGDVFGASQDFMRAALASQKAGDRVRTSDMAWRAFYLTESPQLTDAQRAELREFVTATSDSAAGAGAEAAAEPEAQTPRPEVRVTSISAEETRRLREVETRYRALRDSLADAPRASRSAGARSPGNDAPTTPSAAESVTMMEKIHFAHDRSDLSATAKSVLRDKVQVFRAHPSMQITVTGYTSDSGTTAYNRELGLRRAEAARDYLVSRGVDGTRIRIATGGDGELMVDGPGEVDDAAASRRGEFRVLMTEIPRTQD